MKKLNFKQLLTHNPFIGSSQPATSQHAKVAYYDKIQNYCAFISQGSNAFLAIVVDAADQI